jgi:hypothetical protein
MVTLYKDTYFPYFAISWASCRGPAAPGEFCRAQLQLDYICTIIRNTLVGNIAVTVLI